MLMTAVTASITAAVAVEDDEDEAAEVEAYDNNIKE